MEVIGCESVKSGLVTEEFVHIVVTAYFNGMFEVVRHNMDKTSAVKYVRLLNRYHMQGFSTISMPQSFNPVIRPFSVRIRRRPFYTTISL